MLKRTQLTGGRQHNLTNTDVLRPGTGIFDPSIRYAAQSLANPTVELLPDGLGK